MLLGCGEPSAPPLTIAPTPGATEVAAAPPGEPPIEPAPEVDEARAHLLGRWVPSDGNLHCIELMPDGRFELTRRGSSSGAEVVVRGTYAVEGDDLALRPASIHTERWISRCRRHVTPEGPLEEFEVMGSTLRVGHTTTLRATREGEPLRLCGRSRCEVLWRRARP